EVNNSIYFTVNSMSPYTVDVLAIYAINDSFTSYEKFIEFESKNAKIVSMDNEYVYYFELGDTKTSLKRMSYNAGNQKEDEAILTLEYLVSNYYYAAKGIVYVSSTEGELIAVNIDTKSSKILFENIDMKHNWISIGEDGISIGILYGEGGGTFIRKDEEGNEYPEIVFGENAGIYVMDLDGENLRKVPNRTVVDSPRPLICLGDYLYGSKNSTETVENNKVIVTTTYARININTGEMHTIHEYVDKD
ncbi:hypothetical protein LJC55_04280, partial [Eubacteriales bacterium OttesenSCG-928-N14]|nr:hypothetical protein [Eubacteriales bacterium OttesenSCG-928-N14]